MMIVRGRVLAIVCRHDVDRLTAMRATLVCYELGRLVTYLVIPVVAWLLTRFSNLLALVVLMTLARYWLVSMNYCSALGLRFYRIPLWWALLTLSIPIGGSGRVRMGLMRVMNVVRVTG